MTTRRPAPAARRPATSAFIRGEAGMRRTDDEIERAKQRSEQRKNAAHQPFRFYVPIGETRRIIVTDDKPDFFLYEHALKDQDGKWGRLFTGCIKEHDNCPVCQATGKESYYAMVLSVIDLTPFNMRDGTEVEFSRKLLIVKPAQQKKFLRFYNKEGTLRGAMFDMTRDGDKDSSIGNDIDFVEFVDEDELDTYTRSWKDREGKKHTEVCAEPYVYEDLFEEPTAENLRAIVGGDATPGSRAANERELGGGSRSRPSAPARGRGRADPGDDWEEGAESRTFGKGRKVEEPEEPEDDDEAPARPTRRGAKAEPPTRPSRPGVRGARSPEPEDDDDAPPVRGRRAAPTEDDEDEPPARPARRRQVAEPEEDEDAPPPRRAARAAPPARTPARTPAGARTSGTASRRPTRAASDVDVDEDDIPF